MLRLSALYKVFQTNLKATNDGFPSLLPFRIQTAMPTREQELLNAWELIWYYISVLVTFMNISLAMHFDQDKKYQQ